MFLCSLSWLITSRWNPISIQKKRSIRKENRLSQAIRPLWPLKPNMGPHISPGPRGGISRKISEISQAPDEPGIMDNCDFPPETQCGFFPPRAPGPFPRKKIVTIHAVFGTKKGRSRHPRNLLSRKIHLLKAPQRGPVDGICSAAPEMGILTDFGPWENLSAGSESSVF